MNSGINLFTSNFRISGISSGLDTEKIISDLMKVERSPLDRLERKKQLAEWKRDEYRNAANLIRGLKDEYFNITKSSTYLLSQSSYKKYSAVSSDDSAVTASAGANAMAGTYEITIHNLATADEAISNGTVSAPLQSSLNLSGDDISKANGKNVIVVIDGMAKKITMGSSTQNISINDLVKDIQEQINISFGIIGQDDDGKNIGKVRVGSTEDGRITFETTEEGGANRITILSDSSNDGLSYLKISSGSSNRLNVNETLESLASKFAGSEEQALTFNDDGALKFSINSKEFTFSKTTSLSSMLNTINSDNDAKVTMIYDEITDKFRLTSKELGAGNNLVIAQTGGNFFGNVSRIDIGSIATGEIYGTKGVDATVKLGGTDGATIKRGSNSFNVNGITYNLKKADVGKTHTIKVDNDIDGVFNNIKGFVDKYNELIDTINGKLSEKYDREYQPLTDEEKNTLSEKEVEKWEQRAKTGLLRNDALLGDMVLDMRKALFDGIKDVNINITSIGITTGRYEEKGKLKIDEQKLKEALKDNPDSIANLFGKKSDKYPSYKRTMTPEERTIRYNESGLAQRLFDIVENNITTMRDEDGKKGFLLEKAGIEGDASEFSNSIYNEIIGYDKSIDSLYNKLIQKENSYFMKFAAMEKILGQMNAQSNWLTAQLGNN